MDIRMTDDAPVNKTAVTVAAAADELMVLLDDSIQSHQEAFPLLPPKS